MRQGRSIKSLARPECGRSPAPTSGPWIACVPARPEVHWRHRHVAASDSWLVRIARDATLVALALAGAVVLSQAPRFVQEYEQRLGGALQEARRQLAEHGRLASREGLSLGAFAHRLAASPDRSVAGIGALLGEQAGRAASLDRQAQALESAGHLAKPLVLLRRHDPELLAAAWAKYRYTLTLDPGFAALGALLGLLLNAGSWSLLAALGRWKRPVRS
jgi:hypothetical protein